MTPSDRARLVELCERATPGPWSAADAIQPRIYVYSHPENASREDWLMVGETYADAKGKGRHNLEFIAAARSALPELLAENDALSARLASVEKLCEEAIGELTAASRWIDSTHYRVDDETHKQFAKHIEQAAREFRAALAKKETL